MKNPAIGRSWDEFKKGIPTPAEQAEVDLKAPLIGEMIKAWKELGMMQKKRQQSAGRIDNGLQERYPNRDPGGARHF